MDLRRYKNAMIVLAVVIAAFGALYFVTAKAGSGASVPTEAEATHAQASAVPAAEASPQLTAAASPLPTPQPSPVPYNELELAVYTRFTEGLKIDTGLVFNRNRPFADEIEAKKSKLLALEQKLAEDAQEQLCVALEAAALELGVEVNKPMLRAEFPSWQLISAVCWACGTQEGERLIADSARVAVELDGKILSASLSFGPFEDIVSAAEPDERFAAEFVYCYFRTVYDEEFKPVDYKMPKLSADYVSTIAYPLSNMIFINSWYGPRQNSSRYHLGMDIHASADTPIFSCTDGTVTAIGYDDIAGYYVVVEDDSGYEYHYYHMIRLSELISVGDRVKQGRQIGNVGCTGNSDANHLHLSIITPDHVHLNPYYVMLEVKNRH